MLKKIILIVLFLGILLIGLTISAQEESPKIELNTVYERNLDEVIVDAIYDTATVSLSDAKLMGWQSTYINRLEAKDVLKVEYPKIIKVSKRGTDLEYYAPDTKNTSYYVKELRFYDKDGRKIRSIPLESSEYIYSSPSNRYILVSKMPAEFKPNYSGGTLYDAKGVKVFEMEGLSPIAVSDEGLMVAANLDWEIPSKTGESFYLYDKSGRLIKEIENPDKKNAAAFLAKFSPEGKFAILVFAGTGTRPTYLYIIDSNGKISGHCDLPEYRFSARAEEMDISDDAGFAVILDKIYRTPSLVWEQFVFFLDWRGNIKWRQPLEIRGNMIVKISEDKSKVYVISGVGYIWCFDIMTGREIWKHKEVWALDPITGIFSWEVPIFSELNVKNDILYIIGKQGSDWHSSTLFAFDGKTGNLLRKIDYPGEKITFGETAGDVSLINISKASISILK